jgi:hypothetical protein
MKMFYKHANAIKIGCMISIHGPMEKEVNGN